MKQLHPEDRHYVMYFSGSGANYANRHKYLRSMFRWKRVGTRGNDYFDQFGHRFQGPLFETQKQVQSLFASRAGGLKPDAVEVPPVTTGTGAYRRVYSDPGYSEILVSVFLPSQPSNLQGAPNGTGYIYTGGFGVTGDGIDAGFQYSFINDYYSLFTRDAATDMQNQIPADGAPFQSNQTVDLHFYTLSASAQTVVCATGYDTANNYTRHCAIDDVPAGEWPSDGSGVRVKRMTTIAQDYDDFASGWYFGYDPINQLPQIQWSNAQLASSSQSLATWPDGNGGFQNYPDDSTKVIVSFTNYANETDGIDLHQ